MAKNLLFIADEWHILDVEIETTLIMGVYAQKHGFTCYWATPDMITADNHGVYAEELYILNKGCTKLLKTKETLNLEEVHSIHWRKDPPVTLAHMRLWSLLHNSLRNVVFLNPPSALLKWNEKYACFKYREWCLDTFVADKDALFQKRMGQWFQTNNRLIAKPSADAASRGVRFVKNPKQLHFKKLGEYPLLQKYEPRVLDGETRFLTVGEKILAVIEKKPNPKFPIIEWEDKKRRPTMREIKPTAVQLARAKKVLKDLTRDGVVFATIDFIGDRLLEINITSPGTLHALTEKTKLAVLKAYFKATGK